MYDMWLAARLVHEREARTVRALEENHIAYALSGSNATAAWIATVDRAAVRQCRNVEILLLRSDIDSAARALASYGFVEIKSDHGSRFHDGADQSRRSATEVTFADEPIIGKYPEHHAPIVFSSVKADGKRVPLLSELVRFQLARYRLDDAVDLRDMMDVGLVDSTWITQVTADLQPRLQHLLDTPDG